MLPELFHAALAFLANTLEAENHGCAQLARRVLADAGMPTAAGVQALYDLQAELADFEN
jgi:hypothetical protein